MLGLMHVLEGAALQLYPRAETTVYPKDNAFPSSWKQSSWVCPSACFPCSHTHRQTEMSIVIRGRGENVGVKKERWRDARKKKAVAKWQCVT